MEINHLVCTFEPFMCLDPPTFVHEYDCCSPQVLAPERQDEAAAGDGANRGAVPAEEGREGPEDAGATQQRAAGQSGLPYPETLAADAGAHCRETHVARGTAD